MTTASTISALSSAATRHAAVVGGSLGGLATAHALSQTGWSVDVYERSSTPLSQKGSGLGFVDTSSWESLTQRPMMRRHRRASRAQGSFYYGDLWRYLYEGFDCDDNSNNNNNVKVHFGKTIADIEGTVEAPIVDNQHYDLVVLVDGGFSALRHHVLGDNGNDQPEYAGYVVWRGEVPAANLTASLRRDISHDLEGVYKNGIYDTIVLKMAKDNGEDLWTMGTFVATPEADLSKYKYYNWNKNQTGKSRHGDDHDDQSAVPDWFLTHMAQQFGHVPHLVPLVEQMIQHGNVQPHPQYEFGNIRKVHRGRVLLLGDAAHMASPRTAVGAHTAIMDALALRAAMEDTTRGTIDEMLQRYSKAGVAHAQQLYARSRQVSKDFVPGELSKIVSPEELYKTCSSEESA